MEEVRLFDTATRAVKLLTAGDGKGLKFYACGPTVYGPAHIGNFRSFVVQDLLVRVWEAAGGKVKHVRNLTDVDDKTTSEEEMAAKIAYLLGNDVRRQELGQAGIAKAAEYSWERMAEESSSIYRRAMEEGS